VKVLIIVQHRLDLWNVPAWFGEHLRRDFPELQFEVRNSYEGIEGVLRDAEVLFTLSLRPAQLASARLLRWIHSPSAAVHQFMFPEFINSDVLLTNSREVHGPVVAEHVMALIFALAKKIPEATRFQQKHEWGQESIVNEGRRLQEVAGSTLGLIGVGSIGERVAKMAAAMGMRVIAVREHVERGSPEGVERVFAISELDALLGQSDFVVVAAPVTPATEKLINSARLAAMKPSACLVNVGRGRQVDEVALAEALRSCRIGGAALDVFAEEPLPPESPLWQLDNLLITPHTAGLTDKLWTRHYELFSQNLRRYLAHQPLLYLVDKRKGY